MKNISIFKRYQNQKGEKSSAETEANTSGQINDMDKKAECAVMFDVNDAARLPVDKGRKFILDNVDIHQYTHDMTEEHQNPDAHYCSLMCTENRISGNHLQNDAQLCKMEEVENGVFCPSYNEHRKQRQDYIQLIGRCISENIPCLEPLNEVAVQHISHQYSTEMKQTTDTVSIMISLGTLVSYRGVLYVSVKAQFKQRQDTLCGFQMFEKRTKSLKYLIQECFNFNQRIVLGSGRCQSSVPGWRIFDTRVRMNLVSIFWWGYKHFK